MNDDIGRFVLKGNYVCSQPKRSVHIDFNDEHELLIADCIVCSMYLVLTLAALLT